jgi:phosphopantothenoylcysteine synthetase/decarboxylase
MNIQMIVFLFFLAICMIGFLVALSAVTYVYIRNSRQNQEVVYVNQQPQTQTQPQTQPQTETRRIEQQTRYRVIMPEQKRIEQRAEQVCMPKNQRTALPANQKRLAAQR